MNETAVLMVAGSILGIATVSGRLSRALLTEPLLAMALGLGLSWLVMDPVDVRQPLVLTFLELTLALVLFADAARIDPRRLREGYQWPFRMLVIGLPLTMIAGAALSMWLLGVPVGLALLLGVVLAPTDAALAEPVLESRDLPVRIRQTLNAESGLNDGLALPALFVAVAIAGGGAVGSPVLLVTTQVGVGVIGGVVTGLVGAVVIGAGTRLGWMNPLHQKIAAVSLALAGFAAVQILGGSGFVATFTAGAVLGWRVRPRCEYLYDFAEAEGRSLVLVAFLMLGAGPMRQLLADGAPLEAWMVAVGSLLVARPAAMALSLVGERLSVPSMVFLGWFGPRGLATVVFLLVAEEELGSGPPEVVVTSVVLTVALSTLTHGVTAKPASRWLAARIKPDSPEAGEAHEHQIR